MHEPGPLEQEQKQAGLVVVRVLGVRVLESIDLARPHSGFFRHDTTGKAHSFLPRGAHGNMCNAVPSRTCSPRTASEQRISSIFLAPRSVWHCDIPAKGIGITWGTSAKEILATGALCAFVVLGGVPCVIPCSLQRGQFSLAEVPPVTRGRGVPRVILCFL